MGLTFGLFGGEGDARVVAVPLVRGREEPGVGVEAFVDEDHGVIAALDLSPGATPSIGVLLRIRLGLPEPRRGVVSVPWLRIGDLLVTDLAVREVPGEALVLAIPPGAAVAVRPSRGEVTFAPVDQGAALVAEVGAAGAWAIPPGPAQLPWTDVAIDPRAAAMASAPAWQPRWRDAASLRAMRLEEILRPAEREDLLGRLRWGEYAALRAVLGEDTSAADENLLVAAGSDCRALLAVAERRLRVGDASADEPLDRVLRQREAWLALPPRARERARELGQAIPEACAKAPLWRAGAAGRFDRDDPWETARWALDTGSAPGARFAIAHGADLPALRVLLGQAPVGPDPHPLTTALLLGDAAPDGLAARVVRGTADGAEVIGHVLTHPGDPAAACLAAAASDPAEIPDHPEADCLAARIVRARLAGRDDAEAWAALSSRWPDAVPAPLR